MWSIIEHFKKMRSNSTFNKVASYLYNLVNVKKRVNGRGNQVAIIGSYLKKTSIDIQGDHNRIVIDSMATLVNCKIIVRGSNHYLYIGKSYLTNSVFSFVQHGGKIMVGEQTTMGKVTLLSGEGKTIKIGEDCMFSDDIEIRTTDSHSIISLEGHQRINRAEDVHIGNHVWVGKSAWIWKGANIGDHSVIAFNSVVTKEVPSHSVAKGAPAKVNEQLKVTWRRELVP